MRDPDTITLFKSVGHAWKTSLAAATVYERPASRMTTPSDDRLPGVNSTSIVSTLLDPVRLMVAGSIAGRARTVANIAEYTGVEERDVVAAIGTTPSGRLVEQSDDGTRCPPRACVDSPPSWPRPTCPWTVGRIRHDRRRATDPRTFLPRSHVGRDPGHRAKRLLVLERISLEFDLGTHYAEAEVNDILRGFHTDVATLRRYLVDEGRLDREAGQYCAAADEPTRAERTS